jgi:hypothetical protein
MRNATLYHLMGGSALALVLGTAPPGIVLAQSDPLPPLYQVEMIVFAYDAFDASEELFAPAPANAGGRAAEAGLSVPQRREPFRYEEPDLETLRRPEERFEDGSGRVAGATDTQDNGGPGLVGGDEWEGGADEVGDTLSMELDFFAQLQLFGIRRLSSNELQLTGALATLERLGAYTPLVHVGWVQEGLPESEAATFDLAQLGRFTPSGTVQLHISQFQRLRLRVDIEYQPLNGPYRSSAPTGRFELTDVSPPPRFVLREDRVTRTGELHYFDHPAFGVLAIVRPQARETAQQTTVPTPAP